MPVAERIVVVDPVLRTAILVVGEQRAMEAVADIGGIRPAHQHGHRGVSIAVPVVPPQLGEGASFGIDAGQLGLP